jgi:hypothetical protein
VLLAKRRAATLGRVTPAATRPRRRAERICPALRVDGSARRYDRQLRPSCCPGSSTKQPRTFICTENPTPAVPILRYLTAFGPDRSKSNLDGNPIGIEDKQAEYAAEVVDRAAVGHRPVCAPRASQRDEDAGECVSAGLQMGADSDVGDTVGATRCVA